MPGSDPLWYCHECSAEMRPIVTSPEPLCASCNSSFIEQLPDSSEVQPDDPRAFSAMNRLFAGVAPDHDREHGRGPPAVGASIDPITNLLGAILGMRSPGLERPSAPSPPGSGSDRPTIHIRRDSDGSGSGRTRSGNMSFQFRSGGGGGGGFGMFGGFGRRDEGERREPPGIEELLASMMQGLPGPANAAQGPGPRGSPLLQNMLMGLFGAGIGHPGVGMGASGDGRWGDYVLNQEALDQIITQLMEGNHSAPVPVPEDMISTWPRTILTPGNPLENQDCAVCKESFAFIPPSPNTSTGTEQPKPSGHDAQPQEAITLPCKHSFHAECIEPWVKVKGTCPVCRYELVPQDHRQEGNSNNAEGSDGRPGGSGGSGSGGSGGRSDSSGGENTRNERDRTERERGSPMPPGAYTLD